MIGSPGTSVDPMALQVLFAPDTPVNEVALAAASLGGPVTLTQGPRPLASCTIDCRTGAVIISSPQPSSQRHLSGTLVHTAQDPRSASSSGPTQGHALPVVRALLGAGRMKGSTSAVFGALGVGDRREEGYWAHPCMADAAVHAAAAARHGDGGGLVVASAVDYYGPRIELRGVSTK